ncbi:Bug family tripartite tricarboxylate transporter substrate binding protein [Ottowia sp. VDI28]|uniref:Bug family tripartite tricarboxylate transporter substrate binding protein n=1 Tax=Ottowia sp. VDI28 TaxID=3133968 RepID=UPI003C2D45C0
MYERPISRRSALATITVAAGMASSPACSQTYPAKPIRVIVPYAPGGALDTVARLFSQRMSTRLGASFVVENKPGANTIIGNEMVVRAPADGYTILFAAAPLALNSALGIKEPYDVLKDLAPVMLIASAPVIIVSNPSASYRTLADIISASKATPNGLSFATAGVGSMPHLLGEALRLKTGANLTHIGYKGSSPALQDVIGGAVPLMFDAYTPAGVQVVAGKLRGLAVASAKRLPSLPDIPTTMEQGFPDIVGEAFQAMLVPAGTPPAIIGKLHEAALAVSAETEVREQLTRQGYNMIASTPERLTTYVQQEIDRWTPIVKAAGVKL